MFLGDFKIAFLLLIIMRTVRESFAVSVVGNMIHGHGKYLCEPHSVNSQCTQYSVPKCTSVCLSVPQCASVYLSVPQCGTVWHSAVPQRGRKSQKLLL